MVLVFTIRPCHKLALFAQFLLSIHVLVMSLWMGSLFLYGKQVKITGLPLKDRMHLFGRIAAFVVGILLACGASIALLLIKDFNTLLNTPYGHGFIIKIAFVLSILLLAAFNKWYFTLAYKTRNLPDSWAMPFYLKCH